MKKLLKYILITSLFWSCKTHNLLMDSKGGQEATIDSVFKYETNYQYTIRKDDKVAIGIWAQEELSVGSVYGIYNSNEVYGKWLMVDENGLIELPKLGKFKVIDLQIPQLKDSLRNIYKKWIINPVIDIKILNKEISLLGEFKSPGVLKVDKDQNTLIEMIGRAGGLDFYANMKSIKIIRQVDNKVLMKNIDLTKSSNYLSNNITLHPGDIVLVPSKKNKEFDKRITTIMPLLSAISTAVIVSGLFLNK